LPNVRYLLIEIGLMLRAPLLVDLELLLCFVFLASVDVRLPQPIAGVLIQAVCRHILADICFTS